MRLTDSVLICYQMKIEQLLYFKPLQYYFSLTNAHWQGGQLDIETEYQDFRKYVGKVAMRNMLPILLHTYLGKLHHSRCKIRGNRMCLIDFLYILSINPVVLGHSNMLCCTSTKNFHLICCCHMQKKCDMGKYN